MGTNLKTLSALLCFASLLVGSLQSAEAVRLIYKNGSKGSFTSEITTDLAMDVGPSDHFHAKGTEILKASLEVVSDTPQTSDFPLTLAYTLLEYTSEIEQGGHRTRFMLDDPKTDFLYGELTSLKGKKALIELKNTEEGFVPHDNHDITSEILKSQKVAYLVLSRLREAFFLFGKNLEVGKTIEKTVSFGDLVKEKGKLSFKITAITPGYFTADVQFDLPRQRHQESVLVVASGNIKGKALFSRTNPLDFTIEMTGHFGSSMQLPNKESESQELDITYRIYGTPS